MILKGLSEKKVAACESATDETGKGKEHWGQRRMCFATMVMVSNIRWDGDRYFWGETRVPKTQVELDWRVK